MACVMGTPVSSFAIQTDTWGCAAFKKACIASFSSSAALTILLKGGISGGKEVIKAGAVAGGLATLITVIDHISSCVLEKAFQIDRLPWYADYMKKVVVLTIASGCFTAMGVTTFSLGTAITIITCVDIIPRLVMRNFRAQRLYPKTFLYV